MKKASHEMVDNDDDMLPEYDFSGGVRGKHYKELQAGYTVTIHKTDGTTEVTYYGTKNAIVLAADVQEYFPDARAVNHALRSLIALIPKRMQNSDQTTRGTKNGQRPVQKKRKHSRTKSKSLNSR